MATIHVDGTAYPVDPGDHLLHACLSHGLDLPYFCWHPALGSVGACRQCAVTQFHDEHDTHGRLVMACMTAATDGTRISIADPQAVEFRASVIEWLMTNHPHDCPVCEEGGECHLQDMTLMSGHVYRRYRFRKRTHRNQYLGPFVKHEMNRCIACYRCVRFYREYAGGRDLDVFGAHNHVYFGRQADGVLESEFSGNLVEVCPTGVFTDKTLSAVYTRKWDLHSAPSVCVHCGLGCNTFPNARYGELRRVINRYHHELNGYFLCDRGRYGHAFVSQPSRIRGPLQAHGDGDRGNGNSDGSSDLRPIDRSHALEQLTAMLRERGAGGVLIGIGSPRASLEANFALRALVGPEHFSQGIADAEHRLLAAVLELLQRAPAPVATLREAEAADAALVLGENLPDTAPRLALALRQMVRHASFALAAHEQVPAWQDAAVRDLGRDTRSPLFIASPDATRLDDVATPLRAAPPDIVRLSLAVLHALDAAAPAVPDLPEDQQALAGRIAQALQRAQRPLIIAGTGAGSEALLRTAAAIAGALVRSGRAARMLLTVPECNSLGLALLGGAPLSAALAAAAAGASAGQAATLLVLENDLYRRADRASVDAALQGARHVVVLDHTLHATARRAQLVLPAATFAESSGTLINCEGRAQRFFQLLFPQDEVAASWRWLNEAACACDPTAARWDGLDQVIAALTAELPALSAVRAAAPGAQLRVDGSRIASAPHRESGRTAMYADRTVHEPPPPANADAPYTGSMEGYYGPMPAALYPFFWTPAWNSEQGLNKFQQEVGGPLRGGPAGAHVIQAGGESPGGAAPAVPAAVPAAMPAAFAPRAGAWLLIPQHRVFGSDELSARAPAVAERITAPTLGLNPEDAALLGVGDGDPVEIAIEEPPRPGPPHRLAAELRPALARGVAALSVGLPDQPWVSLPAWARLTRARA
ncbi:MAG TPA: NADH-quinone oxidoreductase subunit NuoG [Steroidobacteraceae bacterium]|nr:NADH-quinone oxidoreductase subunit NuoG [Steroidobacteraceae bacterium]